MAKSLRCRIDTLASRLNVRPAEAPATVQEIAAELDPMIDQAHQAGAESFEDVLAYWREHPRVDADVLEIMDLLEVGYRRLNEQA